MASQEITILNSNSKLQEKIKVESGIKILKYHQLNILYELAVKNQDYFGKQFSSLQYNRIRKQFIFSRLFRIRISGNLI